MERYSDRAIEIVNDLHTERLDYDSEYIPLIDAANQLAAYEDTGLSPEEIITASKDMRAILSLVYENMELKKQLGLTLIQGRWISVHDREPIEMMKEYLCVYNYGKYGGGETFVGCLKYIGFGDGYEDGCDNPETHWRHSEMGLRVTHWQPLPEPLKEKAASTFNGLLIK